MSRPRLTRRLGAGWTLALGVLLAAAVAACSGESADRSPAGQGVSAPAPGPPAARSDVNGDGLADLVVPGPADATDADGVAIRRSVIVVVGSRQPAPVDVGRLAPGQGFAIRSVREVSVDGSIGDVDGDGMTDLRVSTFTQGDDGPREYLLYGRRETTDVQLDRPGPGVQRIPDLGYAFAWRVGDLNGDGTDELVFARAAGHRLVLIYGRRDRAPITDALLREPGPRGFAVELGPWQDTDIVGSAGDLNGDGRGELLVVPAHYRYCGEGGNGCGGHPFVIFGARHGRDIELTGSYKHGFGLRARRGGRAPGYGVPAVSGFRNVGADGDFDGDGLDDLFVTGWEYGPGTMIVHGRRSARAPRLGTRDVTRIRRGDRFGAGAGPLADVNGDSRADVLVMAGEVHGGREVATLRVLFGRRDRAAVDAVRDRHGWRIAIPEDVHVDWYGQLGDVNGDGLADFAVQSADEYDAAPPRTYVLLGTRGQPPRSLAQLGAGGFAIGS
jgi:hypothetical protein